MEPTTLSIKAAIQIQKPAQEVFEAIVDPAQMCNYFISESTGRMQQGAEVKWKFPEFDLQFPVQVHEVEQSRYISFYWEVNGEQLLVEITLSPGMAGATVVTVTEKSLPLDEAGIKWLQGNTEGWANFLACLKAYLEYGINLRKGAFNYPREH